MKMNILITESQERMILNESIGREFANILKQNSDIGKLINSQIKEIIGGDKSALLTFGASIGGLMGPVGDFLEGKYPSMNDVEISLLLTGVFATFFYNSPKLIGKIKSKISEKKLDTEFNVALSKTQELKDTFFDFMESLNITLFKVSNILGFAFLIPLLPYIHQLSEGKLSIMDINKIVTILLSYGVLTITSSTLKEIIVKLIKRFRG
tara:strand:- start:1437 stop:2063 length:627 start_codon:yes stop_codon:yes gene_type:complete